MYLNELFSPNWASRERWKKLARRLCEWDNRGLKHRFFHRVLCRIQSGKFKRGVKSERMPLHSIGKV